MGRSEECPSCRADARVCHNCRFFDQGSYRECREPQASWVKDKQKSNFCGFFEVLGERGAADPLDAARNKLENLFQKGKGEEKPADSKEKKSLEDELRAFLDRK